METSLTDVINGVILNSTNQDQIQPTWVANTAYQEIDPERVSPPRVTLAALQALKQIARQLLRGKFEPQDDRDALQHNLFPDLQLRYPLMHQSSDSESVYVRLELLSDADRLWNVSRLRAEAGTKMKHADALEQWGFERQSKAA